MTIVTVVKNDNAGLKKTLTSIERQSTRPFETIVVSPLPRLIAGITGNFDRVRVLSDSGLGVYSAMNIGHSEVKTKLVLYLNAGDEIAGNALEAIGEPGLIRYKVVGSRLSRMCNPGFHMTVLGTGYCHQAVVFPSDHPPYDTNFVVSADYDLIRRVFDDLKTATKYPLGYAIFYKGGLSTTRHERRDKEIVEILRSSSPLRAFVFQIACYFKWTVKAVIRPEYK